MSDWLPDSQESTQARPQDPLDEFSQALKDAGLQIENPVQLAVHLHRVLVKSGKAGQLDGTYKGHLDGYAAGFIQKFKTGYKGN